MVVQSSVLFMWHWFSPFNRAGVQTRISCSLPSQRHKFCLELKLRLTRGLLHLIKSENVWVSLAFDWSGPSVKALCVTRSTRRTIRITTNSLFVPEINIFFPLRQTVLTADNVDSHTFHGGHAVEPGQDSPSWTMYGTRNLAINDLAVISEKWQQYPAINRQLVADINRGLFCRSLLSIVP